MKSEYIIWAVLGAIVTYLFYLVMLPFIIPIFWAVVVVILFYPFYLKIHKHVKNASLASMIACLTIAIFVLLPLGFLGAAMAEEALNLYHWADEHLKNLSSRAHSSPIFAIPRVQMLLSKYFGIGTVDFQNIVGSLIKEVSSYVSSGIKDVIKNLAEFIMQAFFAFFTMFYLFKDAEAVLATIKRIVPVPGHILDSLIERNRTLITATFIGGVLVGVVQGGLGALAFWFLGLGNAVLWGFTMFIFSFLPTVGTAIVWVPATIYLAVTGDYARALILLVWGVGIVGLADNLLRPFIISSKTDQPPLLLFFSILGAVNAFGLIGIVAGPVILGGVQSAIEIYQDYKKKGHDE